MYLDKRSLYMIAFADIQKIHAESGTTTKQLIREVDRVTERLSNKNPCNDCRIDRQIGNPNRWECECDRCEKPNDWKNECVKKLAEYETAEEEGRLVVLPCKVGSTVYRILYTLAFGEIGDKAEKHYFIRETSFEYGMIDDLNETVFLTREEAEKALKEMEENHE